MTKILLLTYKNEYDGIYNDVKDEVIAATKKYGVLPVEVRDAYRTEVVDVSHVITTQLSSRVIYMEEALVKAMEVKSLSSIDIRLENLELL